MDVHLRHEGDAALVALSFLINDGALVSATGDDNLHMWSLWQKTPQILHSLKFQRERITTLHVPFQSKWLYLGTERGNIHIVKIVTSELSGYCINWNKAIELSAIPRNSSSTTSVLHVVPVWENLLENPSM
ncbi:syntaxin-binding protein 5-like isoform X1 [Scylla paramamosain]|uniref:syntaxin-binding protein 5-like isoform X1 n=1 Tax=Scylla paramamosain TaxID=85552 RepID=UPI0030839E62